MEWNWWGHGAGVGSSSLVDLHTERVKRKRRRRTDMAIGLVPEAIDVETGEYQREGRVVGTGISFFILSECFGL